MVESVLKGKAGDRALPVVYLVVYLDDITVYGDTFNQVLENTAEAMKRLALAGFMINLKKSHLLEQKAKILGHMWETGGYWTPCTSKLEELSYKTH